MSGMKRREFITLLGGATKSGACAGIIEGQAARRREVAAELAVRRYSNKHVARRRRRHVSRDAAIIPL
jgi:serine/threonine-protein kinase RIO1